jgi:hypothetical protein
MIWDLVVIIGVGVTIIVIACIAVAYGKDY